MKFLNIQRASWCLIAVAAGAIQTMMDVDYTTEFCLYGILGISVSSLIRGILMKQKNGPGVFTFSFSATVGPAVATFANSFGPSAAIAFLCLFAALVVDFFGRAIAAFFFAAVFMRVMDDLVPFLENISNIGLALILSTLIIGALIADSKSEKTKWIYFILLAGTGLVFQ